MLTRQGFELDPHDPRAKKAKQQLVVTPIDRSGIQRYPTKIQVWWEVLNKLGGSRIVTPKFWATEQGYAQKHEGLPWNVQPIPHVRFAGALREDLDQLKATDAVLQSLQTHGGAVLSLGVGQGKTTCACWVIAQLRLKTVILVHKDVLRTQWAERIHQFLPAAKVTYVQGSTCDTSGDVVIAMIQTLISPGRTFDWTGFGFVCCDECHRIAAETFSTAMRGLCCPYSLGLSATPQRKDGLTKIIHWFLGPMAYASQRKSRNVIVDIVKYTCPRYKLPPPMTRFGTINHAAVLTDMADDATRTAFIIKHINQLREDPERIVLVLSHRREHCKDIASKVPGAVAFLGGSKKNNDHETAPVVCATYALASEGYDDPRLNTLVLATPCSDVTQAAGRITRGVSTKDPLIIDIQDDFSVAYAQSAKRKSCYAKAGYMYASQVVKEYPTCVIID